MASAKGNPSPKVQTESKRDKKNRGVSIRCYLFTIRRYDYDMGRFQRSYIGVAGREKVSDEPCDFILLTDNVTQPRLGTPGVGPHRHVLWRGLDCSACQCLFARQTPLCRHSHTFVTDKRHTTYLGPKYYGLIKGHGTTKGQSMPLLRLERTLQGSALPTALFSLGPRLGPQPYGHQPTLTVWYSWLTENEATGRKSCTISICPGTRT